MRMKLGLLMGAAAMYLFDPERGEERRRDLRERLEPLLQESTLAPLLGSRTDAALPAAGETTPSSTDV
jgi:hypothetical protein